MEDIRKLKRNLNFLVIGNYIEMARSQDETRTMSTMSWTMNYE